VSPVGLCPKKEPNKYRIIHHLSYPKGISVNDHILPEMKSVNYTRIDDAIAQIFPWSNNQKVIQTMKDFPIGHIPLANPFQSRTKRSKI
jgi:hypothetical protein